MTKSSKKVVQAPKMEELICRLREIQVGLKSSLADLQQKLASFDSEPDVQRLENAKRDAEAKASSLEEEVKRLREELRDAKDFLGSDLEKK